MLAFDHVSKFYGPKQALDDVSFSLDPGEFAFLVGPSGSGKTTVLRLIVRELLCEQGTVSVAGVDVAQLRPRRVPEMRRLVAVVPQDFRLLSTMNVRDNVAFALDVLGWPRQPALSRATDVLELVGLSEHGDRLPDELSGGERQRVALARALAGGPAVLLADEPTGNLDPASSVGIIRLLEQVNEAGCTVLVSSHDQGVIDAMRQRVISLADGRLVSDRPAAGYSDARQLLRSAT